MSAKNRGRASTPCDFFQTPAWCVRAILDAGALPAGGPDTRWLEPSAGSGAIVAAASSWLADHDRAQPSWMLYEARSGEESRLRAMCELAVATSGIDVADLRIADFLDEPPPLEPFDVALGNPPYGLALDFVRKLVDERWARRVCLLLRAGFLESAGRWNWLKDRVPDTYVLTTRPSFAHGATDATMYAWLVWTPFDLESRGRIYLLPPNVRARDRREAR